jgi:hypothetical protein
MSETCQMLRERTDVLSESITLVKNMLRLSISSICHVRELFQQGIYLSITITIIIINISTNYQLLL